MTNALKPHELAEFYPMHDPARFADLVEGMKKSGYRDEFPIVVYEGKILDGRNRYNAALEAGVEPYIVQFSGDDPVEFVVQANSNRRDLEIGQRAAIALKIQKYLNEKYKNQVGRPGKNFVKFDKVNSRNEAAKSAGVSTGTLATVAKLEKESPDLFEKVAKGELTPHAAQKQLKQDKRKIEGVKASKVKSVVNLYHGDMLTVLNELDKFDLVVADSPYNVTGWDWDKLGSRADFLKETQNWLEAITPHLSDKYNMFWFCSPAYAADIEILMRGLGFEIKSRLVWHRRNMAKGSDAKYKFVDSWEMIFHVGNRELNFPPNWDDSRFDVQTFAVPQTNFNDTKYHPTQKPEELIRWLVSYGSFDGDKVLDPFAGSGTTAATCEGREYTLIEMAREYVKVIEQRFGVTSNARI